MPWITKDYLHIKQLRMLTGSVERPTQRHLSPPPARTISGHERMHSALR